MILSGEYQVDEEDYDKGEDYSCQEDLDGQRASKFGSKFKIGIDVKAGTTS